MDKAIYFGIAIVELGKLLMYETYYDTLQYYFGGKIIHCHYIDTEAFVRSVISKDIIKNLKNLENLFDFSNLIGNNEIFSDKNKRVTGRFKLETPRKIYIDEFLFLISKMFAYKCANDNKLYSKGICDSLSKIIKIEEYRIYLHSRENQKECDNFIRKSMNH